MNSLSKNSMRIGYPNVPIQARKLSASQQAPLRPKIDRSQAPVSPPSVIDCKAVENVAFVPEHFDKTELQKCYLTEDGNDLSPTGKILYSHIAQNYLSNVPQPVGQPTLTMTGGLPGSGKGQLVKIMQQDLAPFVVVDADKLKDEVMLDLLDKNPALEVEMVACKEWASVSHRVSRVLAHQLIVDAVNAGKDCLFDSTLAAPKREEYRDFVSNARAHGFSVQAKIAQVEVETAVQRAELRSQQPHHLANSSHNLTLGGRYVPSDLIRGAYEGLISNRDAFIQEGLFDSYQVYDNNQQGQPIKLIQEYHRVCLSDGFCTSTSQPLDPAV
jgi:predicted ABC-type ATPase